MRLLLAVLLFAAQASAQDVLNVTLDQNTAVIDPTANWLYDLTANQFVIGVIDRHRPGGGG